MCVCVCVCVRVIYLQFICPGYPPRYAWCCVCYLCVLSMCVHACMYICIYVCACVCIYIYIYIHAYTCVCTSFVQGIFPKICKVYRICYQTSSVAYIFTHITHTQTHIEPGVPSLHLRDAGRHDQAYLFVRRRQCGGFNGKHDPPCLPDSNAAGHHRIPAILCTGTNSQIILYSDFT